MIALDFETALIEPGLNAPPPVCVSYAGSIGEARIEVISLKGLIESFLTEPLIIGANIAFDLAVACAEWPELFPLVFKAYDEDRITDVQIRQKLIDCALGDLSFHQKTDGYSLAALTKRLCDRELAKEGTWRLRYWELAGVPLWQWPEEAIEYPKEDAIATRDVFTVQESELAAEDRLCVLADQYRQARADFALQLAHCWGLRTDHVGVAALRAGCEGRMAELLPELTEAGLLRSTKKGITRCVRVAQARMLQVCPNARLTAKGQELGLREIKYVSVDEEACSDSGDPILEHYSEYAKLGSLLSGHVTAMEAGTVLPIHTRFEVLLETGRTSSSGPNVQNVRRLPGARECFVPREGWVYIGCDFEKAELHTLAQCCIDLFRHSALANVLNAGLDPHIDLGAELAGVTYDVLKAAIAEGDAEAAEWRQRAKPGNFGFPGGMGPEGMRAYAKSQYGVIMTIEQCEHLYAGWRVKYPEVAESYLGWIRELTAATGFATIEHFGSHRWRGHVPYCTAANSFFQGRSADGMKAALYDVVRKCYLPGTALYGCRVVNEVHDEIIAEAPIAIAARAAEEMRTTMITAYNRFTPDVPVHATSVLMDRWSKKAKQIIENGELQIWRYAA